LFHSITKERSGKKLVIFQEDFCINSYITYLFSYCRRYTRIPSYGTGWHWMVNVVWKKNGWSIRIFYHYSH